ncbi:hypothetical protein BDW22DRAFT_1359479 [Trametopsis cervina]|nr:hypothetical protein BDW22DRAFT_1359479 [Trametopsis cervina]
METFKRALQMFAFLPTHRATPAVEPYHRPASPTYLRLECPIPVVTSLCSSPAHILTLSGMRCTLEHRLWTTYCDG